MKKLFLVVLTLSLGAPFAFARDLKKGGALKRNVSGLTGFSLEDAVTHLLQHEKLAQEKISNPTLGAMILDQITVEGGEGKISIWLSYNPMSGKGAPCSVKAIIVPYNTVPEGAAGVNMQPRLETLHSGCALN